MPRLAAAAALVFAPAMAEVAAAAKPEATNSVEFNRDIRPLLSENCYFCHGPDPNQRKAKLRLDDRDDAMAKKAIVPGKPGESELVARIFAADEDDLMPPPETHKSLKPEQKELLKRWIAEGAEYQTHWAYAKLTRPALPAVRSSTWVANPIDAFILSALEMRAITPSPEADRRRLLRRVAFDLTGLPPDAAAVEEFARDPDPRAYERAVERLLRSPHYGERMAVAWLDTVRFADTVGYHGDQNQNIFPYRDYVIAAFNRNKPFDEFTVEQIAGDLLARTSTEQLVATGFNRLNMVTREGGAQPGEYLAKYAADRVRTVGITWLGSTLGCAECHDHKFDPFTTRDFYSLAAFFADIKQWGVYSDYKYTPNPDLKGWSNDHPFPPELEVRSPYLTQRSERLAAELDEWVQAAGDHIAKDRGARAEFETWRKSLREFAAATPAGWLTPPAEIAFTLKTNKTDKAEDSEENKEEKAKKPEPPAFEIAADGSIRLTGDSAEKTEIRLKLEPGWIAALRLELLPDAKAGGRIFRGKTTEATLLPTVEFKTTREAKPTRLKFWHGDAEHKQSRYQDGFEVLGIRDGWKTSAGRVADRQYAFWLIEKPVEAALGDELVVTFSNTSVAALRLSVSPLAALDPFDAGDFEPIEGALSERLTPRSKRAADTGAADSRGLGRRRLIEAYLLGTSLENDLAAELRKRQRDWLECRNGVVPTLITLAAEPQVTRVLPRGNWQDESGPVVQPAVPGFLPGAPTDPERRLSRLDLARWLIARDNPLTARVQMNRLWRQFFGTGLSAVLDDVGAQGEPPSHPELLDWLAAEFMDSGWDVRHMVRLIVLSSTYRQDSRTRPELRELDSANRLLAFHPPRRLEAEFVRDNALSIAGLLTLDVGGPSARPYQPAGYYANLQFPDREYVAHRDDRQYRRGLYAHWQRTFLHPMLANFDAPAREECTANRTVSNTPQQALTLLNDPSFVEAARVLAARALERRQSNSSRIDLLFRQAVGRPPHRRELESLDAFLGEQRRHYRDHRDEAAGLLQVGLSPAPESSASGTIELAAWTSLCRVILNLHETITRY